MILVCHVYILCGRDVLFTNIIPITVPDLTQLDPKVVQLLALQRVQQLLSTRQSFMRRDKHGTNSIQNSLDHKVESAGKIKKGQESLILNGWKQYTTLPVLRPSSNIKGKTSLPGLGMILRVKVTST